MKSFDYYLASGLVLSPAWVPEMSTVSEVLSVISLCLGIILAVLRIRKNIMPDKRDKPGAPSKDPS